MIPLPVNQLAQEGWRVQVHNDKRTFTALSSNIKLRKLDTLKISHGTFTLGCIIPCLRQPLLYLCIKGGANVLSIISKRRGLTGLLIQGRALRRPDVRVSSKGTHVFFCPYA